MSLFAMDDKKRYAQSIAESVYSSKSACHLQRRKLMMIPAATLKNKNNNVSEIILSAREKKVKHIRSQLTDANLKLTDLSKENNILKCIQKRHEEALQRYESVNGDVPKLMTGQSDEIRKWQTKYKELKKLYREASQNLNKKYLQFSKLSEEHEHLLKMSKRENLGELTDLQDLIKEMTLKVEKHQETIDCLQRRLALDEKAHKQELNAERERIKEEIMKSEEAANQSNDSSPTKEYGEIQNPYTKQAKLPTLQTKISKFKSLVWESGRLPSPPAHIVRGTMIPRLQIPIPETDKESSDESVDERSYRTRTLSRKSESYASDFNDYTSDE